MLSGPSADLSSARTVAPILFVSWFEPGDHPPAGDCDGLNRLVEGELRGRVQGRSNRGAKHDRARGGHARKGRPS